ncbi:MAG: hypothetical protein R3C30_05750 [Hyphomonadaceae bacterium]
MSITETKPATIANLWQRLRAMMVRASDIVGALPALAILASLSRRRHREIASAITRIEAIARKLILVAAADLHRAEHNAAKPASSPLFEVVTSPRVSNGERVRAHARVALDPMQPETWRVRFKLAPPRDPGAVPESRAPRIRALWGPTPAPPKRAAPQPQEPTPAPMRLALRFEALRRVIVDPAPYARRLARILPRLCRRFSFAAERYAVAIGRPYAGDEGDPRLMVEAIALAMMAAPVFVNSS